LTAILPQYAEYGALAVSWQVINSAIGASPPTAHDLIFLETLHYAVQSQHVKVIYQPKYVNGVINQHVMSYLPNYHAVSSTYKPILSPFNKEEDRTKLFALYHFFTRDWEYCFFEKICSETQLGHQGYMDTRAKIVTGIIMDSNKGLQAALPRSVHEEPLRKFLFVSS